MRVEEIHEAAICEVAKFVYRVRITMIEPGRGFYCDLPTLGAVYAAFLPAPLTHFDLGFHCGSILAMG